MLERIGPRLLMLALLTLAGCQGRATEPATSSPPPTPGQTSAEPSSPSPTPTSTSASPSLPLPTSKPSPKPPGATPASTKEGTYANQVSISEDGALSFVPLRWFTGKNAEVRCREKGIKPEGAWCGDYYYEKAGSRQAAALTGQTRVRLLNDDLKPVDATLAQLVDAVESEVWPNFQIAVADGNVVRISQVFTP